MPQWVIFTAMRLGNSSDTERNIKRIPMCILINRKFLLESNTTKEPPSPPPEWKKIDVRESTYIVFT